MFGCGGVCSGSVPLTPPVAPSARGPGAADPGSSFMPTLRRRVQGKAVLAVAVAGLSSLASAAVEAKDIKICLIAGKTGALEAYAKQTENGFMMGLEYLTQGSNKVGNDKLEVIVKDDQLKPDRGKTLLEECYGDDKADLAVGRSEERRVGKGG